MKLPWKQCKGMTEKDLWPNSSLIGCCCCKCDSLSKINHCGCGKCNASESTKPWKYACLTADQQETNGGIELKKTPHGICECFQERKHGMLRRIQKEGVN